MMASVLLWFIVAFFAVLAYLWLKPAADELFRGL